MNYTSVKWKITGTELHSKTLGVMMFLTQYLHIFKVFFTFRTCDLHVQIKHICPLHQTSQFQTECVFLWHEKEFLFYFEKVVSDLH